jgi:Uma2 family endonuclease
MVIGPVIYPPQPITFEQYMAEEQVKRRYDIVNGVRVFAVPPSFRHQDILGNLLRLLCDYGRPRGYATFFSLFDVLISWEPFCTRQPNVMLVSEARLQAHRDGEPLAVAPELVVEIVSSVDRELALENKLRDYRRIGVQECWVVSPEGQVVEVMPLSPGASQTTRLYRSGQAAVSAILPDLSVVVDDVLSAF